MPSNKDPIATVQPGPGRLPDGTVTASSLDFELGGGSEAALQAHISDPENAHASSAIGTGSHPQLAGSADTRTSNAPDMSQALDVVFSALNSQAVWVLDANGHNGDPFEPDDCDFAGTNAFISAVAALSGSHPHILFLKPGTYNWGDSTVLTGLTVVGDGGGVTIQTVSGGFRFSDKNYVRGVTLVSTQSLAFSGTGGNRFEDVLLNISGSAGWSVTSSNNTFSQCRSIGSFLTLSNSGASNKYENVKVSDLYDSSPIGNNQYQGLILTGASDVAASTFRLETRDSSFDGVTIQSQTAYTAPIVLLGSSAFNNKIAHLVVGSSTVHIKSTNATKIIDIQGGSNLLEQITVQWADSGLNALSVTGTSNSIQSLRVYQSTLANTIVSCFGVRNHISDVDITSCGSPVAAVGVGGLNNSNLVDNIAINSPITSMQAALVMSGTYGTARNLRAASCSLLSVTSLTGAHNTISDILLVNVNATSGHLLYCDAAATDCHLDSLSFTGCSATGSLVHIAGSNSVVQKVYLSASTAQVSLLTVPSSAAHKVSLQAIVAESCTWNGSAALEIAGTNCSVTNFRARSITPTGTILHLNGAGNTADKVRISDLTNVNSSVVKVEGIEQRVRDVVLESVAATASGGSFHALETQMSSTLISGFVIKNCPTMAISSSLLSISGYNSSVEQVAIYSLGTASTSLLNAPLVQVIDGSSNITVRDLNFGSNFCTSSANLIDFQGSIPGFLLEGVEAQASSGSRVLRIAFPTGDNVSWDSRMVFRNLRFDAAMRHVELLDTRCPILFENCYFRSYAIATECFTSSSGVQIQVKNSTFESISPAGISGSPVEFENCTFLAPYNIYTTGTTLSQRQFFWGYGRSAGVNRPAAPMVLRNCKMLVSNNNLISGTRAPADSRYPMIFFGGTGRTGAANHGATVVDGLYISYNPTLPSGVSLSTLYWHTCPTLTVDLAGQNTSVELGSYSGITIDLKGQQFNGSGATSGDLNNASTTGVYSFLTIGNFGTILEIRGADYSPVGTTFSERVLFRNTSILKVPRGGGISGGFRSVIKAQGVRFENLTVDSVLNGTLDSPYEGPVVAVGSCDIQGLDLFPIASPQLDVNNTGQTYAVFLWAENHSHVRNLLMRNLHVPTVFSEAGEARAAVHLEESILSDSDIRVAEHVLFSVTGSGEATIPRVIEMGSNSGLYNCKIETADHNKNYASLLSVVYTSGDNVRIMNNIMRNTAAILGTGTVLRPTTGAVGTITNGAGGGLQIRSLASRTWICNNHIQFSLSSNSNFLYTINAGGSKTLALNNTIFNDTQGAGVNGGAVINLFTGSSYSKVCNNVLESYSSFSNAIGIQTNGGGGYCMVFGNTLDNSGSGNATVTVNNTTDLPITADVSKFNTTTS